LAHVIKDLWTAVNSVVSMIEVTTMFVRSSLGRDTGRRKQEGLLTGNNRQKHKKLMKVLYPKNNK
jgi:hypothetical protein